MPLITANAEESLTHDPVLRKLMHGKSSEERNAFFSMLKKDSQAHKTVTREYVSHWEVDGNTLDNEAARDDRKRKYTSVVNKYVRFLLHCCTIPGQLTI